MSLARARLAAVARWAAPASFIAASALAASIGASRACAQERALTDLTAVRGACQAADDEGVHDRLYAMLLDRAASLEVRPGQAEGLTHYVLQGARNLRALGGAVQLVPSHLEPIVLVANEAMTRAIEVARARGVRVRLGFFLGFDEPDRRACLVRARQAVTTVRVDVAFVELLDATGAVVAREDHDRLRAWSDDPARSEARGPEARVGAPSVGNAAAPEAWARALRAPALAQQLLACHVAGLERGVPRDAMVQARLRVEARTGRVEAAAIEVGNVADVEENVCLVAALGGLTLPPIASATGTLELRVPVFLRGL